MAPPRHLQLKLLRATDINACTKSKARTFVHAKVTCKRIVYKTSKVEDMGQNPIWEDDGTNVFHFDVNDDSDCITVELFNRNDACIGESKLSFADTAKLLPEDNEEKTLPVMVPISPIINIKKQFGEVVLQAQMNRRQAMGVLGLLKVVLIKGHIEKITSIFGSKTTEITAKLIYKHTTFTSGILKNMGNKFVWLKDNTFSFLINSRKPDDKLTLQVFNYQTMVGECEMSLSSITDEEMDFQTGQYKSVTRTEELLLVRGPVGTINVAVNFVKTMCRRNSYSGPSHPSSSHGPFFDRLSSSLHGPYSPHHEPYSPHFEPYPPQHESYDQEHEVYPPKHDRVPAPSFDPHPQSEPDQYYPPRQNYYPSTSLSRRSPMSPSDSLPQSPRFSRFEPDEPYLRGQHVLPSTSFNRRLLIPHSNSLETSGGSVQFPPDYTPTAPEVPVGLHRGHSDPPPRQSGAHGAPAAHGVPNDDIRKFMESFH